LGTCEHEIDCVIADKFSSGEVAKVISGLKNGKKGGFDELSNEHLKHGVSVLASHFAYLFNGMYEMGYVPVGMKRGLIYTLYKGSRKYSDDRKNYRGISLLPVVTKVFERVVLCRIKSWLSRNNIGFPSNNQNAYQESLCSLLTSFQLQECINYNTERKSKVFVCLLDSSSAFDTVWHTGLFHKLHTLGIRGKTWKLLYNSYTGMTSNVVLNGFMSPDIKICKSVRQGSVLGPWFYLIYIHDLALSLITSKSGAKVEQILCGTILHGYGISLAALTHADLQDLVTICGTV
jgi:hypothetical protein